MKISTTTISNTSTQIIKVLYSAIASDSSVSDIDAADSGELLLAPGGQVNIESSRLDLGQLDSLSRKNLISYLVLAGTTLS